MTAEEKLQLKERIKRIIVAGKPGATGVEEIQNAIFESIDGLAGESLQNKIDALPFFQANSTASTQDAAYQVGQTVKFEIASEIRLFEALLNQTGVNNPAPTGEEGDLNWKEVSPSSEALMELDEFNFAKPYGQGELCLNLGHVFRRTNYRYYPGDPVIMPYADLGEVYWKNLTADTPPNYRLVVDERASGPLYAQGTAVKITGVILVQGVPFAKIAPALAGEPCVGLIGDGLMTGNTRLVHLYRRGIVRYAAGTAGFSIGDALYLSATEAGKLTNVKPQQNVQRIGTLLAQGTVLVEIEQVGGKSGKFEGVWAPGQLEADTYWIVGGTSIWRTKSAFNSSVAPTVNNAYWELVLSGGAGVSSWYDLEDIPETFPTAQHKHTAEDIEGLIQVTQEEKNLWNSPSKNFGYVVNFKNYTEFTETYFSASRITAIAKSANIATLEYRIGQNAYAQVNLPIAASLDLPAGEVTWRITYAAGKSDGAISLKGTEI